MITVAQHLDRIRAAVAPLAPRSVPLSAAAGLVLEHDVTARHRLPLFDNAAMDGYAVRAADVAGACADSPARLRVVADVPAGSTADPAVGPGEAARIMTGAPVPTDADAVVPLEHTKSGALFPDCGEIAVTHAAAPGAQVRTAGEEIGAGEPVLRAPLLLAPRHLAAAAAAGSAELVVHPAPRVAVFATGSELVPPGRPLARGQIAESNSLLLSTLVAAAGGEPARVAVLGDEPDGLRAAVAEVQASVDLIVITGGIGAGAYDVVRRTFCDELEFSAVAMQPGRPQAFGRLPGGPPLFGLPGNPVAAAVSFEAFVRPALARLRGLVDERRSFQGVAATGWHSRSDREQFLPVVVDGKRVRPAGAGRSHFVASLAQADAYAVVPIGVAEVRRGDTVTVLRATGGE